MKQCCMLLMISTFLDRLLYKDLETNERMFFSQKRAIAGNNTAAEMVTCGGGAPVNQANGFSKKRARQSFQ